VTIDDLDLLRVTANPAETHSPPVIDPNAMLTLAAAKQSFKPIAGRHARVLEADRGIQLPQFPEGNTLAVGAELPDRQALEEPLSVIVRKAPDHQRMITRCVISVKKTLRARGISRRALEAW
jgi:hypothetical protein